RRQEGADRGPGSCAAGRARATRGRRRIPRHPPQGPTSSQVTATVRTVENAIDNAIVAVTVYPSQARVTRRGRVTLDAGEHVVELGPLPMVLDGDSIRVSGRGPVTILGADT